MRESVEENGDNAEWWKCKDSDPLTVLRKRAEHRAWKTENRLEDDVRQVCSAEPAESRRSVPSRTPKGVGLAPTRTTPQDQDKAPPREE